MQMFQEKSFASTEIWTHDLLTRIFLPYRGQTLHFAAMVARTLGEQAAVTETTTAVNVIVIC